MIVEEWCGLEERFHGLELDAFVVMPDHIHGIVVLDGSAAASRDSSAPARGVYRCGTAVPRIMQAFKSLTTRRYREIAAVSGLRAYERRLWQRNYYEHVVRSEAELMAIREYIVQNSAKADDRAHGLW